ncbi:MAG: aminoacyl-tRNA hydrolase [Candidatus Babeliaceae bacterium]|nr:aminoacyl-tRNA hydrolase [Candidatus Babeliaceae bacterium]
MKQHIKLIIGLGNPGQSFYKHRHSIGFRVLDAFAEKYHAQWLEKDRMLVAEVSHQSNKIYLVKPQTFMNNSGQVLAYFTKKGINPEEVLVVHDELELPVGKVTHKKGGSARGHNGLKSIISYIGDLFHRIRIGIGRPLEKLHVPDYVLQAFQEGEPFITEIIEDAVELIETLL